MLKYLILIVVFITSLLSITGCQTNGEPRYYTEDEIRQMFRQERQREQIRQHGAGGCTPNFSTGGCL